MSACSTALSTGLSVCCYQDLVGTQTLHPGSIFWSPPNSVQTAGGDLVCVRVCVCVCVCVCVRVHVLVGKVVGSVKETTVCEVIGPGGKDPHTLGG